MFTLAFLATAVSRLLVWVVAAPIHEFAHAWTAVQLGDDTPARQGRLTLDPRAHLDVLGTVLIAFAGFGWARPVAVQPYYLRYGPRMGMLLVALAGPVSNLLLACLFAIPVRLGLIQLTGPEVFLGFLPTLSGLWTQAIGLNILLFFFNLLPLAPLDGFKVVAGLLPEDLAATFMRTEPWGIFVLIFLSFVLPSLWGVLIGAPTNFVFRLLVG